MAACYCIDCGAEVKRSSHIRPNIGPAPKRCGPCKTSRQKLMDSASQPAHLKVAQAIRRGDLLAPANFACVDCGAPATRYDHRDYTKPLDVQPVCRACNYARGPADRWHSEQP